MPERTGAGYFIRPARIADYDGIQPLAEQMDSLHREHLPDRFRRQEGPPRSREYITRLIADKSTLLAVAESLPAGGQAALNGRLLGVINAGLAQTPDIPVKVRRVFVKIRGIVVSPEVRRQGIGRALLQEASNWAVRHGAVEVQLSVYAYNLGAMEFFGALGFAPLSHRLYRSLETVD